MIYVERLKIVYKKFYKKSLFLQWKPLISSVDNRGLKVFLRTVMLFPIIRFMSLESMDVAIQANWIKCNTLSETIVSCSSDKNGSTLKCRVGRRWTSNSR